MHGNVGARLPSSLPCRRNPYRRTRRLVPSDIVTSPHAPLPHLPADTPSVAHLPAGVRSRAYALLTIGPERPRIVTLDPVTETLVDGPLYGNANLLTSKELCLTTSNIREGAFVRLEQCNPGKPTFQQMFSLTRVQTPEMAAKKVAREAKKGAKGALGLLGRGGVGCIGVRQGGQGFWVGGMGSGEGETGGGEHGWGSLLGGCGGVGRGGQGMGFRCSVDRIPCDTTGITHVVTEVVLVCSIHAGL